MHLFDIAKEVKTVSDSATLWNALATGQWIDKNWNNIDKVSKSQAIGMFLTGVRPTAEQSDLWTQRQILASRKEAMQFYEKNFDLWWGRAIMQAYKGDTEMAQQYKQTALSYLNNAKLTPDQIATIWVRSNKLYERYVDRIDPQFFQVTAPPNRYNQSMDAYRKKLQLQRQGN
jgi:hypothetical protein